MSNINIKNMPKLKLSDLLRRRKLTLTQFMEEFGITTHAGLQNMCNRMGVLAPEETEFDNLHIKKVSNPSEGVVVLDASSEQPAISDVANLDLEVGLVPTDEPTRKTRKKRDISPIKIDE